MIGAGNAPFRKDFAGERAKTPLHAVADNRAADFLGDRKADSDCGVIVLAVANEEDETGRGCSLAAIGSEEIGPLLEDRGRS